MDSTETLLAALKGLGLTEPSEIRAALTEYRVMSLEKKYDEMEMKLDRRFDGLDNRFQRAEGRTFATLVSVIVLLGTTVAGFVGLFLHSVH